MTSKSKPIGPLKFAEVVRYLWELPGDAWRKNYRVRTLNALSVILDDPSTPVYWSDDWCLKFPNFGYGTLREVWRLLGMEDAPPHCPSVDPVTGFHCKRKRGHDGLHRIVVRTEWRGS